MRSERALKRKQKRNRIRRTKQIIERVLLTICLIALLAIGSSAILTKATTNEEAKNVYYKYCTKSLARRLAPGTQKPPLKK